MALAKTQEWGQAPQAPHWMRLLEEKYQRLHAKIVNQAARFSHRRRASIAATRILKESQRKHASCSRINTDQDGLVNDQELAVETPPLPQDVATEQGEIKRGIISSDYATPGIRAKTAKSLSKCVIKQSSDHSINPRPQTQHGTRSSGIIEDVAAQAGGNNSNNCSNSNNNNNCCSSFTNKVTPLSSGVVTRVSSAYPFTRVSSTICDNESHPSPRIIISTDEDDGDDDHAEQLNFALNLHLDNHENEFDDQDFIFNTTLPSELEVFGHDSRLSYVDQKEDTMNVKCHTERDDVTGRGRRRRRAVTRPVKTSVSRISHKTSKSCPATLLDINKEINDYNNNNGCIIDNGGNKNDFARRSIIISNNNATLPSKPPVSLEPLTAQGLQAGRMRVFARMSLEARHAIDETLKEMKMEEGVQQVVKPMERDDDPSCVEESVNNVNTSADSIRNNVSVKTGEEPNVDQRLKSVVNYGIHQNEGDMASDASVASTDSLVYALNKGTNNRKDGNGFLPSRSKPSSFNGPYKDSNNNHISGVSLDSKIYNSSRRLPQLGENSDSFQERFPTVHAPLPAIKNVNRTFRESTFEITPPDFDIRFREIITCQKGDRETPPLDVRQQSIDKCQQWLVRYTPRR